MVRIILPEGENLLRGGTILAKDDHISIKESSPLTRSGNYERLAFIVLGGGALFARNGISRKSCVHSAAFIVHSLGGGHLSPDGQL